MLLNIIRIIIRKITTYHELGFLPGNIIVLSNGLQETPTLRRKGTGVFLEGIVHRIHPGLLLLLSLIEIRRSLPTSS